MYGVCDKIPYITKERIINDKKRNNKRVKRNIKSVSL